jgi:hypothetical protein
MIVTSFDVEQAKVATGSTTDLLPSKSLSSSKVYPEQFDIMVTVGCNAKCAFCVQEVTFKPTNAEDDRFLYALSQHFRKFYHQGGRKVIITGGEPLLVMPRVIGVLRELASFPDLQVKALYTNGEKLLYPLLGSFSVSQTLQLMGLKYINLSVHHNNNEINNKILGLPHKPSTETITSHLNECRLPFRLNLTLQKGGIKNFEDLLRYVEWGFNLGAQDIYIRELFQFSFDSLLSVSDQSHVAYCRTHRVKILSVIDYLLQHKDFKLLSHTTHCFLEQTEYAFMHLATNRRVYLSRLMIGTENQQETPYLVLMPDARLYKGWLGSRDSLD